MVVGLFVVLWLCFLSSCQKDTAYFSGKPQLRLSTDTIFFDTTFTTIGSSTRVLKIYNDEDAPVLMDIALKNQNPQFRFLADGLKGNSLQNLEIGANDSLYVFVETTINPDEPVSSSPYVIEEFLEIKADQTTLECLLLAFGQNANYIPAANAKGAFSYLSCDLGSVTWDDPKPYVIYGVLIVDSCTLVIPPGTNIYVHGGIAYTEGAAYNDGQLIFLKNGKLDIQGTFDKPVKIEGDRPEAEYRDVAGQWGGIRFIDGSNQNTIKNLVLRNSVFGVFADSAAQVELAYTRMEHIATSGIIGVHASIKSSNVLVYDAGQYSAYLSYGGQYDFDYCTFASYTNQNESLFLSNYVCTDPFCQETRFNPGAYYFTNCIMAGGSPDEIALTELESQSSNPDAFNYNFEHCVVKVKDLLKADQYPNFLEKCNNCLVLGSSDKLFKAPQIEDFSLDSMSIAISKALPLPNNTVDLLGRQRDITNPDIGCLEFQE